MIVIHIRPYSSIVSPVPTETFLLSDSKFVPASAKEVICDLRLPWGCPHSTGKKTFKIPSYICYLRSHVYLYIYLFIYLFIYSIIYLCIYLFNYRFIHLHIYIYICIHIYTYIYIYALHSLPPSAWLLTAHFSVPGSMCHLTNRRWHPSQYMALDASNKITLAKQIVSGEALVKHWLGL